MATTWLSLDIGVGSSLYLRNWRESRHAPVDSLVRTIHE